MIITDELVTRFLNWPLPHSVCCDPCTTKQQDGRTGTNLLSAIEAKAMLEHVLATKSLNTNQKLAVDEYCKSKSYLNAVDPSTLGPTPDNIRFLENRIFNTLIEGIKIGRKLQAEELKASICDLIDRI